MLCAQYHTVIISCNILTIDVTMRIRYDQLVPPNAMTIRPTSLLSGPTSDSMNAHSDCKNDPRCLAKRTRAAHRVPACNSDLHALFHAIYAASLCGSLPSPGCQRCSAPPARHSRNASPALPAAARRRFCSALRPRTAPRVRQGGGPPPAPTPSTMCTASCAAPQPSFRTDMGQRGRNRRDGEKQLITEFSLHAGAQPLRCTRAQRLKPLQYAIEPQCPGFTSPRSPRSHALQLVCCRCGNTRA